MSASISTKKKNLGSDFLRATASHIVGGVGDYFSDVLPVTSSTMKEAKSTIQQAGATLSNTTQTVLPKLKQLRMQAGFRNLASWYSDKEQEFDSFGDDSDFTFDIEGLDDNTTAELSETNQAANQISQSIIESSHKSMEGVMVATANISTSLDKQSSIISTGFDRTISTLDKILEIVTKNTATLIEVNAAAVKSGQDQQSVSLSAQPRPGEDMKLSGKFNLNEYKKMVSKNASESELGLVASMMPMVLNPELMREMLTPQALVKVGLDYAVNKKNPNFKKNMKALDDAINDTIMTSLIRLGEKNDSMSIRGMIGQIFGISSERKNAGTSKSKLELKAVPFDSIAHEAITAAIPGYLRQMVLLMGGPDMTYDYRSRTFKTKQAIANEFHQQVASTGTMQNASKAIRDTFTDNNFNNMMYDLMMNDLGSNNYNGSARAKIDSMMKDSRAAEEYMRSLVGKKASQKDQQMAEEFGRIFSEILQKDGITAIEVGNQVAKTTAVRNQRSAAITDEARRYNVDLSHTVDNAGADEATIRRTYGYTKKGERIEDQQARLSKQKSGSYSSRSLDGVSYTNMALYEIYRRLNEGINVFRVGKDDDIRSNPFEKFKDDYLKPPIDHKPKTISSISGGSSSIASIITSRQEGEDNLLRNNTVTDENGNEVQEQLSGGQRFARWGKKRGGNLAKALFSGSPEEIRSAFGAIVGDVADISKDAMKSGVSKINDSFGNISGYLKHKMFGTGYSYKDQDGNMVKVKDQEQGGMFGFIKTEFKTSFSNAKKKAGAWLKDVAGYFDFGDKEGEEKGTGAKRKKLLLTSAGAFAGAGLLGGPIGLVVGGLAGNMLSLTGIGEKVKNFLIGHDENGKPTGILTKAADAIVSPIRFQIGKTLTLGAGILKKHLIGPLADIGLSIKDRIENHVTTLFDHIKNAFFAPFKFVGKLLGKAGKTLGEGLLKLGSFATKTIPGKLLRGAMTATGALVGGMGRGIAKHIAGGGSYHKLKRGEVYELKAFQAYVDLEDGKKHIAMENETLTGGETTKCPMTKDYLNWRKKKRIAEVHNDMEESGFYGSSSKGVLGKVKGFFGGDYKQWHDKDLKERQERRARLAAALQEDKETYTPDQWAELQKAAEEEARKEEEKSKDETVEAIKEQTEIQSESRDAIVNLNRLGSEKGSIYTHDAGIHGRLDRIIEALTGKPYAESSSTPSESSESSDGAAISDMPNSGNDEKKAETNTEAIARVKEEESEANRALFTAANQIADEGGIDKTTDRRNLTRMASKVGNGAAFSDYKRILEDNIDQADDRAKDEEEKSESFISKLMGGLGSALLKFWPVVAGGLLLFSDKIRNWFINDVIPGIGNMLIDNLPKIISAAWDLIKGAGTAIDQTVEASATDSQVVVDPASGESKIVTSAEEHLKDMQDGAFNTAVGTTFNIPRLLKDAAVISGERAVISGGAALLQAGAKGFSGLAGLGNTFKGALANTIFKNSTTGLQLTSQVAQSTTAASAANVASKAGWVKNAFQNGLKSIFSPTTLATMAVGVGSDISSGIAYETVENNKHNILAGDYGMNVTAGGFVRTGSGANFTGFGTNKTLATTTIGTAGGIAMAAAISKAGMALGASLGFSPAGWAIMIGAGIVGVAAALGALANVLIGWIEDGADIAYAIRSNSSKLNKVINGSIDYNAGSKNPMYVYCGQESDRVLGLTKGLNVKDPELLMSQFMTTIKEGLATAPGAEVMLYDLLNNMAYQGVPFAVRLAGDSKEVDLNGKQANDSCTPIQTSKSAVLQVKKTQVLRSTVKKNIDKIYADMATNIKRQGGTAFNEDDLEAVYDAGDMVVEKLTNEGILNSSGKVQTNKFKNGPGAAKNAEGWASLEKLGKKKGIYFVSQCLAYLNSKIDVDKNSGKQWLTIQQENGNLEKLGESLIETANADKDATISDLKAQGFTDEEIEAIVDPKGDTATPASTPTPAESAIEKTVQTKTNLTGTDKEKITNELRYIAAAYAYSHPSYLEKWVKKNQKKSGVNVDYVDQIDNWKNAFSGDTRKQKTLKSQMITAALNFADEAGDIFNLLDKFDWSSSGKILSHKKISTFGAAFPLRGLDWKGEPKKEGKSVLDEVFNASDPSTYSPLDVHKRLFGKKEHDKASESRTTSGQDATTVGSGQLAQVADAITTYGSSAGRSLTSGDNYYGWRNALIKIPAWAPPNLPAVGGPAEESFDDIWYRGSTYQGEGAATKRSEGGNPLNKEFNVTSPFGGRNIGQGNEFHNGIDIVPKDKSGKAEVGARFSGTVVRANDDITTPGSLNFSGRSQGNEFVYKTDEGYTIKNYHLAPNSIPSRLKQPGARVNIGDKVGDMGHTGRSTGAHLHYEIVDPSGKRINPYDSITKGTQLNSFNGTSDSENAGVYSSGTNGYYSSDGTSTTTESSGATFGNLISQLLAIGNEFLYNVTGGLIGSLRTEETNSSNASFSNTTVVGSDQNTYNTYLGSVESAADFIALCEKEIGTRDDGNNRVKYNDWYWGNGTHGDDYPWCMAFVQWCFNEAGLPLDYRTAGCTSFLEWYEKNHPDLVHTSNPKPGDIILFHWKGKKYRCNHTGIYKSGSGSSIITIEGNTSDNSGGSQDNGGCVARKTRSMDQIVAFVRAVDFEALEKAVKERNAAVGSLSASGDVDVPALWAYFKGQGYSDEAIAGIFGCWTAESGIKAKRVEWDTSNSFKENLGDYDAYANNPQGRHRHGINLLNQLHYNQEYWSKPGEFEKAKKAYSGDDGTYYPGIGYAQWTGPRAQRLVNFAKQIKAPWYTPNTQMAFMALEMSDTKKSVGDALKAVKNPTEAVQIFAKGFEGFSADSERIQAAQQLYNQYAGKIKPSDTLGSTTSTPDDIWKRGSQYQGEGATTNNSGGVGGPKAMISEFQFMSDKDRKNMMQEMLEPEDGMPVPPVGGPVNEDDDPTSSPMNSSTFRVPNSTPVNKQKKASKKSSTASLNVSRGGSVQGIGGPTSDEIDQLPEGTEPPIATGSTTSLTGDEVVALLNQLLAQVTGIHSDTGSANSLLTQLNGKDFGGGTPTTTSGRRGSSGKTKYIPPTNPANTRMIKNLARP